MKGDCKYRWTVFFLIRSVDGNWVFAHNLIKEILGTVIHPEIGIVICLNANTDSLRTYPRGSCRPSSGNTTLFLEIERPSEKGAGPKKNKLSLIREQPDFDIRNPADLIIFFQQDVLRKFRADRYMLFTWDHGAPFGIFRDEQDHLYSGKGMGMLNIDDLANAIVIAFNSKKIDVVVMMNCFLQSFDTGYSLAQASKFLIAAETYIRSDAYNYSSIFKIISQRKNISAKKLCEFIVESSAIKNAALTKDIALFANRLKYYKVVGNLIHRLALSLDAALPDCSSSVVSTRKKIQDIQLEFGVIDFFFFLELLKQAMPGWNNTIIDKLLELKPRIVVSAFIGEDYLSKKTYPKTGPMGFSIFFPPNASFLLNPTIARFYNDGSNEATLFTRVAKWNEFVINFLGKYLPG